MISFAYTNATERLKAKDFKDEIDNSDVGKKAIELDTKRVFDVVAVVDGVPTWHESAAVNFVDFSVNGVLLDITKPLALTAGQHDVRLTTSEDVTLHIAVDFNRCGITMEKK